MADTLSFTAKVDYHWTLDFQILLIIKFLVLPTADRNMEGLLENRQNTGGWFKLRIFSSEIYGNPTFYIH